MAESTNFNGSKSLKESKALKICYWFTNITYYLCFAAVAFVVMLISFNLITGNGSLKYMHLPVVVTYDDIGNSLPLDQNSTDALMPVVGFQMPKVDVSNYKHMSQMLWLPLMLMLGLIYLINQFRLFLRTVRFDSPFAPENPKRLKLIGYIVTAGGPIVGIINYIYAKIYIHFIDLPGATIEVENEVYPFAIFLGLMIIVIGHVFEIAANMKIEQDLTI